MKAQHKAGDGARPILVSVARAAELLDVCDRTFLEVRKADWMPKAIQLSAGVQRYSLAELEAAVARMPRVTVGAEPVRLLDAKKRRAASAPVTTVTASDRGSA